MKKTHTRHPIFADVHGKFPAADVQVIRPSVPMNDTGVFAGLRRQLIF